MFPTGPKNSWRSSLHQVKSATQQGRLDKAVQIVRRDRLHQYKAGQKLIRKLVDLLLRRASEAIAAGNIAPAWSDLSAADAIGFSDQRDRISQQMTGLVELTIEQAEWHLKSGNARKAASRINELWRRRIADSRADRISQVANLVLHGEKLASEGKFRLATRQMQAALDQRPDLTYLQQRIENLRNDKTAAQDLTRKLRHKILDSHWKEAKTISSKLLHIAPGYQVAIDALKRCLGKSPKPPKINHQASPAPSDVDCIREKDSQIELMESAARTRQTSAGSDKKKKLFRCKPGRDNRRVLENDDRKRIVFVEPPVRNQVNSFLLWIDGTGGFLVCDGPGVVVGQAIEQARVEIPIQGDLNRRHMRFHQTDDGHLLEPWGDVTVKNRRIKQTTALGEKETISLGAGIVMSYRREHPLSASARLELTSRHRTQPWSDAIILMADMVVIGPGSNSHVRCSELTEDIILFKKDGQLMCRYNGGEYEIDGKSCSGRQKITVESRISGEDFSILLEPTSV